MRLPLLSIAVLALVTAGCRCDPNTSSLKPDYVATPTALSFEACPTKDEQGAPVNDVFPDTKKVTLSNQSKVGAGLKLSFQGQDADAFKLDTSSLATAVGPLEELQIPVSFSPAKKGDLRAELVIDDDYEGTDNVLVSLLGTGTNLPAQPSIETAVEVAGSMPAAFLDCSEFQPLYPNCTVEFPNTLFNESQTLRVKIKNKGCPALKVTGLRIESNRGDSQGYTIESPTQLPSTDSPILLSTADGTEETTVTIRFSPVDDGSGDTDRTASLVVLSNDPLYGDGFDRPSRVVLTGQAIKPSIYVTPGYCDMSNDQDQCGNDPKIANKGTFRVTNDGNDDVKIDKTTFANGGVSGRFTITTPIVGTTLAPTQSATLEVTHMDDPLYVNDQLKIEAVLPNQGNAPGGSVTIQLYGGKKPCLTTDPVDTMNFNNPTEELTAQVLRLSNGASCGTLILNNVTIDPLGPSQPNPFFSLIDPLIPPNFTLAPGAMTETTVQYKRPASGGQQLGTLRVRSNDSDFGPPAYKVVQLISQSPLDAVPVAQLSACVPAELINDPQCTVTPGATAPRTIRLSQITPDEITLSGALSTDNSMVKEYRFRLEPPYPAGVTSAALANNDQKIMTPTTKLTIPPGAQGTFRVSLAVWDDRGQQSGNSSVLNLNIYP